MALGAQPADVLAAILIESMLLVGAGLAIGLAAAWASGQFVRSLLFGLEPTDALSIGGAALVMILVSLVAGYLPARRASRIDPLVALRQE
jgi:ABC-type antimicrobial peptide transport system permease subunit